MDLALLVEEQGELLNRIEAKVNSTDDYIVPAVSDIEEAEQDEEKSSKVSSDVFNLKFNSQIATATDRPTLLDI